MKNELKVGSRVVVIGNSEGFGGAIGTVVFFDGDSYAVELDEYFEHAHSCMGMIEVGYGYWFNEDDIQEIDLSYFDIEEGDCDEEEYDDWWDDDEDEDTEGYGVSCDLCDDCCQEVEYEYKVGDVVRLTDPDVEAFGELARIRKILPVELAIHACGTVYPYILEPVMKNEETPSLADDVFWSEEEFELMSSYEVFEEEDNVIVIVNFPAVIYMIKAYGRVFKGVSKCDLTCDTFDAELGMQIAMRRAIVKLAQYELKLLTK